MRQKGNPCLSVSECKNQKVKGLEKTLCLELEVLYLELPVVLLKKHRAQYEITNGDCKVNGDFSPLKPKVISGKIKFRFAYRVIVYLIIA